MAGRIDREANRRPAGGTSAGGAFASGASHTSEVEAYLGSGAPPPSYDFGDPLSLGAWAAALTYLHRNALASKTPTDSPTDAGSGEHAACTEPSVWEFEQDLLDLVTEAQAVLEHGEHHGERHDERRGSESWVAFTTALAVLEALFPAPRPCGERRGDMAAASATADVPRWMWEVSDRWLGLAAGEAVAEEAVAGPPDTGAAQEPEPTGTLAVPEGERALEQEPEQMREQMLSLPLANVIYAARLVLGEAITQSEAARRLGVSPARVSVLVGEGRLRHIRVGRAVLLAGREVELGIRDRRRSAH